MMPNTNCATKAARQIKQVVMSCTAENYIYLTEERIASIITSHAEPLVALLRESKREHYECLREGDEETTTPDDCTCGADATSGCSRRWKAQLKPAEKRSASIGKTGKKANKPRVFKHLRAG